MKNFESLSQLAELVGKPNHPVHLIQFPETVVWVFGAVCVGSQSFGVGFLLGLFFWIPDYQMKVLKNFESLSQPIELVGKPDQPIHWVQFFWNGSFVSLFCLCRFLVIQCRNCTPFVFFFLVSLLCKECSEKFSELFSTGSTGWGTGSASFSGFVRIVRF